MVFPCQSWKSPCCGIWGAMKTPVPTESRCLPTSEEMPGCLTCGGALLQAQVSAQAVSFWKLSFCCLSVLPLSTDWKRGELKSLPCLRQYVCLSEQNGDYYLGPQLFRVWYPWSLQSLNQALLATSHESTENLTPQMPTLGSPFHFSPPWSCAINTPSQLHRCGQAGGCSDPAIELWPWGTQATAVGVE